MKANIRDLKFDAIVKFPRLDMTAKYHLDFGIFGFQLKGQGDSNTIIDNSRGRITMRAKKYINPETGKEHMKFDKILIKIQIGSIKKATLTNLFGAGLASSSIFQEILNTVIRTQPEFVVAEINPPIERTLSEMTTDIINQVAKVATYDEVFPVKSDD